MNTSSWTCPNCGAQNASPFCTNCGCACPAPSAPADQAQAPQQVYAQPIQQPYDQQPFYGQPAQQPMPTYYAPNAAPAQTGAAFPGWSTNIGFSILGCLAAGLANGIFAAISDMGAIFYSLVYCAAALYYSVKVYPSCFTKSPMLADSKLISFLNLFIGGVIFGCLWNHNLTRGQKGISNVVYAVMCGLSLVVIAGSLFLL